MVVVLAQFTPSVEMKGVGVIGGVVVRLSVLDASATLTHSAWKGSA